MAIRIKEDDRINEGVGDEEVYLPGPLPGSKEEGPFEFSYPRLGKLIKIQRRLRGMNLQEAGVAELDGMMAWLAHGFGPEAWAHISGRLAKSDDLDVLAAEPDKYDLLDEEHLTKLFQLLNEGFTGRPTTSSNGASRQPWKNDSTAAPSPLESVSPS